MVFKLSIAAASIIWKQGPASITLAFPDFKPRLNATHLRVQMLLESHIANTDGSLTDDATEFTSSKFMTLQICAAVVERLSAIGPGCGRPVNGELRRSDPG